MVVSLGHLNLIAEYEAPKTEQDLKTWAEGVSCKFVIRNLTLTPKAIFAQFSGKFIDVLGGEIKLSYSSGNWGPFFKVKVLDFLSTGQCSTNMQGGVQLKL